MTLSNEKIRSKYFFGIGIVKKEWPAGTLTLKGTKMGFFVETIGRCYYFEVFI
jgi:hypothetical protein